MCSKLPWLLYLLISSQALYRARAHHPNRHPRGAWTQDRQHDQDIALANGLGREVLLHVPCRALSVGAQRAAAAGSAVVVSGRRTPVRLVEVSGEERPPVRLAYVQKRAFTHSGAQSARHFFGLGPNLALEQMTAIADRFVVFRIDTQA